MLDVTGAMPPSSADTASTNPVEVLYAAARVRPCSLVTTQQAVPATVTRPSVTSAAPSSATGVRVRMKKRPEAAAAVPAAESVYATSGRDAAAAPDASNCTTRVKSVEADAASALPASTPEAGGEAVAKAGRNRLATVASGSNESVKAAVRRWMFQPRTRQSS